MANSVVSWNIGWYFSIILFLLSTIPIQKNKTGNCVPFSVIENIDTTIIKDLPGDMQQAYYLAWQEEFNVDGKPDPSVWVFEKGFVRNEEKQWYNGENAVCKNGILTITAKKEKVLNPFYIKDSKDWRTNREFAFYSASAIETHGKKEFTFGSIVVCAKIDTATGAWPAIWTVGKNRIWPNNGEIDIMEFYRINQQPTLLANAMWGKWNSSFHPLKDFLKIDPHWPDKFHVWRMDWDKDSLSLYVDNQLLNRIIYQKDSTLNSFGENPFLQPHYLRLNLAIDNRVDTHNVYLPIIFQVDYVHYYKRKGE